MRSLTARIVLVAFAAAAISLAVFVSISEMVVGRMLRQLFETTYAAQADDAVATYERDGQAALAKRLDRLNRDLHFAHHLVDLSGRDVITGEDRSRDLALVTPAGPPQRDGDRVVGVWPSGDGRYRLIGVGTPPFSAWTFLPFYLLVPASIGLMAWWAARSILVPIRRVTAVADRLGRGELTARVSTIPQNEIGTLATTVNAMAERIGTLLQAERQLLQDVSHELRSPLARLNLAVELARTADNQDAIGRIQTDLDRLSVLIAQLIEMTRAEGDPSGRWVQPVDLDELVAEVGATCARDAEARGAGLVISGRTGRMVQGDRELLRWAVENVVRNATRYTPPGTAVELTVGDRDNQAVITVRDFGPGVPASELARIFDPFYRVETARTPSASGGVGLGLAIASRAAKVHHGTIVAANASPGLRVTITLPMNDAAV